MSYSEVEATCVHCQRPIVIECDHGSGTYHTGGRMDPVVALITHGKIVGCRTCNTRMVFKTDFMGGLYVEQYV